MFRYDSSSIALENISVTVGSGDPVDIANMSNFPLESIGNAEIVMNGKRRAIFETSRLKKYMLNIMTASAALNLPVEPVKEILLMPGWAVILPPKSFKYLTI